MRGFRDRAEVDAVLRLIDERVHPLHHEAVTILEAGGRVLARDATAMVNVPAFDRSAMDGYAVIAEETFGSTPGDPCALRVVGESFPARPAEAAVAKGSCVRIMTGAPMPDGADAVVPVEQTAHEGEEIRIHAPVTPGKHVGRVGEDVKKGDVVLKAGRRLRPQDVGLLSALGFRQISVVRRPRVAILITGNEILPAGSMPEGHRIVDANTPMLLPLVKRDGGTPLVGPIVPDDREQMGEAFVAAFHQADCVLVSGGSSVGERDHAPLLVRQAGELPIHGVAMRPSSPAGVGFVKNKPVFLLPGNPVSCLCAYDFFAGRAIRRFSGLKPGFPHTVVRMPLKRKIASALGRTDYVRVRIENSEVVPLAIRGASILSSTTRAHGFVIVKANDEGYAEGTPVSVHLY
jgi:molybdopterin molybdotransferase